MLLVTACKEKSVIEKELDILEIDATNYIKTDTSYFDHKKIKSLRFYINKKEYTEVKFYKSGKKKVLYTIKNNQIHGKNIHWYENDSLESISEYNLGIQIGKQTTFFENGNRQQSYDNDTDESIDYWENGKAKFRFIPKKSQSYHYLNGNYMEKYAILKDGKIAMELYNENGELVFSGIDHDDVLYKNDSLFTGKIICYFNTGKISHYEERLNGKVIGKYYGYYGNGNLKFEGEKESFYKHYSENGKLDMFKDVTNKTSYYYDEEGKPIAD